MAVELTTRPDDPHGEVVRYAIAKLRERGRLMYGSGIFLNELEEVLMCRRSNPSRWVPRIVKFKHELCSMGMYTRLRRGVYEILLPKDIPTYGLKRTYRERDRRVMRLKGMSAVPRNKLTPGDKARFDYAEQKLAVMVLQDEAAIAKRRNDPPPAGGGPNPYK